MVAPGYWFTSIFKTNAQTDIKTTDLISVKNLVLAENPLYGTVKSNYFIDFKCIGYDRVFQIDKTSLNTTLVNQILSDMKAGDSVTFGITKKEFNKMRKKALFNKEIEIISLRKGAKEYLDIDFRNYKVAKGSWDIVPAVLYAGIMCLVFASLSKKPIINPTLVIAIGVLLIIIITAKYA